MSKSLVVLATIAALCAAAGASSAAPSTAPSVTIAPLAAAAALTGDVPIEAMLQNLVAVRVEYVIDDQLRHVRRSPPYVYVWPTAGEMNGRHTVTVRAFADDDSEPLVATKAVTTKNRLTFSAPLPSGPESAYVEFNQGDLATARNLLDDVWPARGFNPPRLGWPLSWQDNPRNDAYWRFYFYALRPTASLLWAWKTTNEQRYLDKLIAILRSYVAYDKTRAPNELTFDDKHTAGYRAMVLTNTYVKLKREGVLPSDLDADLPPAIAKIGAFLVDKKNYEPTYNHGYNEALGLMLVAHNFATLPEASIWRATALQRLTDLIPMTIDADGVDTENSPFYHFYVLGMIAQIAEWAIAHEPSLAGPYATAMQAMLPYAAYVTQPNGWLPMLGATATTVVPEQDPAIYGPMTAYSPEFEFVYSRGAKGTPPAPGVKLFPTAGLFLMRAPLPTTPFVDPHVGGTPELAKQTFITFDAGPYRTSHSDFDGLSITLYSSERTLLPDSGLYTYDQQPDRGYFHGTRSHNTVVVDGKDQPAGTGTPSPGRYGRANGSAWATGTSTLYEGVTHRRTVVLLKQDVALVVDNLASDATHHYAQTWHLFPGAEIVEEADGVIASTAATSSTPAQALLAIRQASASGLAMASVKGGTDPMQGWQSVSYGSKTPTWALEHGRSGRDASFATLLLSGPLAISASQVRTKTIAGAEVVTACVGHETYAVTLAGQGQSNERLTVVPHTCDCTREACDYGPTLPAQSEIEPSEVTTPEVLETSAQPAGEAFAETGAKCAMTTPRHTDETPIGALGMMLAVAARAVRRKRADRAHGRVG